MKRPNILVVIMGGTIDGKAYNGTPPERITPLEYSIVPDAITYLGHGRECDFYEICMEDSNDVTVDHLQHLAEVISDPYSEYDYILVTHGTDTMPRNARYLSELLGKTDKVVVFTGAMQPLANGERSDGYTNLDTFFAIRDELGAGVHVIMNERLFPIVGLRKDFERKRFYVTDAPDNEELPPRGRGR